MGCITISGFVLTDCNQCLEVIRETEHWLDFESFIQACYFPRRWRSRAGSSRYFGGLFFIRWPGWKIKEEMIQEVITMSSIKYFCCLAWPVIHRIPL